MSTMRLNPFGKWQHHIANRLSGGSALCGVPDHRLRQDSDPNSGSPLRLGADYLGIDEDSAEECECQQANDKFSPVFRMLLPRIQTSYIKLKARMSAALDLGISASVSPR